MPRPADAVSPAQVGFSVPKKKFRSSVHRHRIRRLMVEAWRLHKHTLYPLITEGQQLHLFLIFTDITLPTQEFVKDTIIKGMEQLSLLLKKQL